jgi:hypothetical protein
MTRHVCLVTTLGVIAALVSGEERDLGRVGSRLATELPAIGISVRRGHGTQPRAGGVRAKGWTGRVDARAEQAGRTLADTRVWEEGAVMYIAAGPPATYWNASHKGVGTYTASATFRQPEATARAEYYGLLIGGTRLNRNNQNYLYCLIATDGTFQVKHVLGTEVHTLAGRTPAAPVRRPDASGAAANELSWRVTTERAACAVNGTEVWSYARSGLIGPGKLETMDGIVGLRVEGEVTLQVTGFRVTPETSTR